MQRPVLHACLRQGIGAIKKAFCHDYRDWIILPITSNIVSKSCKCLFALLLLLFAAVVAGVLWLQSQPRQISSVSALLIKELQSPTAPYELAIDSVELDWSDWRRPVRLRMQGIHITSAEYDSVMTVPAGYAALDVWALLLGEFRVASLGVKGVQLALSKAEDAWELRTLEPQLMYRFVQGAEEDADEAEWFFPIDELSLEDSSITLFAQDKSAPAVLVNDITLALKRSGDKLKLSYRAVGEIAQKTFDVNGVGEVESEQQNAMVTLHMVGSNPSWFCNGWMDCEVQD